MAWIFPKIEMGLFKWTCLILCFDFNYADVTQQPQEWILKDRSVILTSRHDLKLGTLQIWDNFTENPSKSKIFAIFEKFLCS